MESQVRLIEPKTPISPSRQLTTTRLVFMLSLVVLYILTVMVYFIIEHQYGHASVFSIIIRPLPVLYLILILPIYATITKKTRVYILFIAFGMIFCILGDILTIVDDAYQLTDTTTNVPITQGKSTMFIVGMAGYLIGKFCYTVSFSVGVGKISKWKLLYALPFYVFGAAILAMVLPKIRQDFGLFVVYQIVESTMGWRALALTGGFPGSDRAKLLLWFSVVGACCFITGDTLLVLDVFYAPFKDAQMYYQGAYWLAQLLVAFSVPRRLTESDYLFKFIHDDSNVVINS